MPISRREWAATTLGLVSAADLASAWQHAHSAAASPLPREFEFLSVDAAQEIEAITSQIIPSDGTPGAKEAGVIHFIDRALATWDRGQREAYRSGMEDLQQRRRAMFPDSASLATLTAAHLIQLLTAIESTPFFELLRTHTVLGFLGPPSYGGNRGGVGWAHIGVEDRMIFEPPFGYYDAEMLSGDKP